MTTSNCPDSNGNSDTLAHNTAYAVEMEGAAIGQAAALNGIPFLIIRAISDKADNSANMDYPAFEKLAIEHSVRLTQGMLKRMA